MYYVILEFSMPYQNIFINLFFYSKTFLNQILFVNKNNTFISTSKKLNKKFILENIYN